MAHIVYITNGMASTLNSSFELSRRLAAAGHRLSYVSPAPIEAAVAAHGYPFYHVAGDGVYHEQRQAATPPWQGRSVPSPTAGLRWVRRCRAIRQASAENDEIERLVSGLRPDLLLIDIEMHFAVIATADLGIPTALPVVWFTLFDRSGLPPLHTDLVPDGTSRAQAWAIRAAWWRTRLGARAVEWRRRLRPRGYLRPIPYHTVRYDDLRAVARARGYPLRQEIDRAQWLRPFGYRRLPILCFNAWEMEFPHDPHPHLHYVGPMVREQRGEPRFDAASRARWSALLRARDRPAARDRPLVYCSLGSFWSADRAFLRRVVEVFERRPEWDLVLGLGGKLSAEALAPVPPNVTLLDWAPQIEVLERADCAITHGGIGTINECVWFGVPMVVYSTKHVDQDGCAARVAYHGLGVAADKDGDTSEQIERNVAAVLTEPAYRNRVAAMREHVRAYAEARVAVRTVEGLLRAEPAAPSEAPVGRPAVR